MTNFLATQLSLIAESDFTHQPIGDWEYDELGTEILLVPNIRDRELGTEISKAHSFKDSELGTEDFDFPNFSDRELGTEISLVPNWYKWQPPIGGLEQKPIKDRKYWYWRYYDNRGKKASLYLAKDYNKAVARAIKIGIPANAKSPQNPVLSTDSQTASQTSPHLIDIAPTAYPAPRAA